MKKVWLIAILVSGMAFTLSAQKEENVWAFGSRAGLDFNGGTPRAISTAIDYPNVREGCASVCNAAGRLEFYTEGSVIWNRNHNIMPNGNLGVTTADAAQGALIVPVPGSEYLYYVFSQEPSNLLFPRQRLYYSVVDMSLNNGLGDVVAGQKAILLKDSLSERLTAVAGDNCDVWIVVRSDSKGEYLSFRLAADGLSTTPVVSPVVTINIQNWHTGILKFSHDRKKLASTRSSSSGLLEIADFNPATGVVSNNLIIASSGSYYGVCFSPDDSKLYASMNYASPSSLIQYDLSLGTLSAIQASATVLYNHNQSGSGVGDIKEGPDGKLYFVTSTSSVFNSRYVHVIANPNALGTQSQVQVNAIPLAANSLSGHGLPNQVVIMPAKDTVSASHDLVLCHTASLQLPVDSSGSFYEWENGNRVPRRVVTRPGVYSVSFRKGCTIYQDTFNVVGVEFPSLSATEGSCADEADGMIAFTANDTTTFYYEYKDEEGEVAGRQTSNAGSELEGLRPGNYTVLIKIASSDCEKIFHVQVNAYPVPDLRVSPGDTVIRYGDSIRLNVSGADSYLWEPYAFFVDPTAPDQMVRPLEPVQFTVTGTNTYGCRSTRSVNVDIDFFIPDLIPNAFSPNGDGVNDFFKVEGLTYQEVTTFRVFNRYGQTVFSGQDARGWDGTYNSQPCEAGVYYYFIQLSYPSGERKTLMGDVLLLR